ncbi:MAG: DUF4177 domain-containing protein [Clostridia bacterium]|nr:DUF4177 domain-containing protein [Clostridia bacterium]
MYKVVFIDRRDGAYEIQRGKIDKLAQVIKEQAEQGYELLTMTTCPPLMDAHYVNFVLVFKEIK